MKTCSKCQEAKPERAFYADKRRTDGLRPRCINCYRAGLTDKSKRRTPEQRAEYRRRIGEVSKDYVPAAIQRAGAQARRAESAGP